jgi:hypothetical protein
MAHLRAAEGSSDWDIWPEDGRGMGLGNLKAFFTNSVTP